MINPFLTNNFSQSLNNTNNLFNNNQNKNIFSTQTQNNSEDKKVQLDNPFNPFKKIDSNNPQISSNTINDNN